jgi:hypothetical protein
MSETEIEMRSSQTKMWDVCEVATRLRISRTEEEPWVQEAQHEGIGGTTRYAIIESASTGLANLEKPR